MRVRIAPLLLFALACAAPARSADESHAKWRVVQAAGTFELLRGGLFRVASDFEADLEDGTAVRTGRDGRVVLRRGGEQVVISPNSRIVLTQSSGGITEIDQLAGMVWFNVGKRHLPHFEVRTLFLTGLVKGTTFTVSVDKAGATLGVREGAVEVATSGRNAVTLVRPGSSARVRQQAPRQIEVVQGGSIVRTITSIDATWSTALSGEAHLSSSIAREASDAHLLTASTAGGHGDRDVIGRGGSDATMLATGQYAQDFMNAVRLPQRLVRTEPGETVGWRVAQIAAGALALLLLLMFSRLIVAGRREKESRRWTT